MALKAIINSLEEVAENLRDQYVKHTDGTFRLAVEGVKFPEDIAGLQSTLGKQSREIKELKESLEKFNDVDPDEYKKWKQDQEDEEANKHRKKNDWEAREEQLKKNHTTELGKKDQEVAKWKGAYTEAAMNDAAKGALAKHAPGSVDLLLPHVLRSLRIVEEDGKPAVRVVDEQGVVQIEGAEGKPQSVESFVTKMRENPAYKAAFPASGASGSGATPPTTPQGGFVTGGSVKASDPQAIANQAADIVSGKVALVD